MLWIVRQVPPDAACSGPVFLKHLDRGADCFHALSNRVIPKRLSLLFLNEKCVIAILSVVLSDKATSFCVQKILSELMLANLDRSLDERNSPLTW